LQHDECPLTLVWTFWARFNSQFILIKIKLKQSKHTILFIFLQSRLREMVEYDDLAELQARELPSLKIADSSKFSQGLIPAVPKVRKIINHG